MAMDLCDKAMQLSNKMKYTLHATKAPNFEGKHYLDTWEFDGVCRNQLEVERLFMAVPNASRFSSGQTAAHSQPAKTSIHPKMKGKPT